MAGYVLAYNLFIYSIFRPVRFNAECLLMYLNLLFSFFWGISQASEFYIRTFRSPLFYVNTW